MTILLAACVAALVGAGVWLLMHRDPLRAVIGAGLIGHGTVLLLVLQANAGEPPLVGEAAAGTLADPVPHALALTAIVISFGVVAYLLAVHRGDDDDTEEPS